MQSPERLYGVCGVVGGSDFLAIRWEAIAVPAFVINFLKRTVSRSSLRVAPAD